LLSDARIIVGNDEDALVRLWREKRGEVEPEDLSGNLIVQLGVATETLNRRWYGGGQQVITPTARKARKPDGGHPLMGGRGDRGGVRGQVHAAWSFSEEAAAEKYIPHCSTTCVGGGGPAGSALGDQRGRRVGRDNRQYADPLYQHLIVTAERKFWRCVETGDFIAVAVAWNASSTCRAVVKVFLVPRAR
jgi:hypothetical protein